MRSRWRRSRWDRAPWRKVNVPGSIPRQRHKVAILRARRMLRAQDRRAGRGRQLPGPRPAARGSALARKGRPSRAGSGLVKAACEPLCAQSPSPFRRNRPTQASIAAWPGAGSSARYAGTRAWPTRIGAWPFFTQKLVDRVPAPWTQRSGDGLRREMPVLVFDRRRSSAAWRGLTIAVSPSSPGERLRPCRQLA